MDCDKGKVKLYKCILNRNYASRLWAIDQDWNIYRLFSISKTKMGKMCMLVLLRYFLLVFIVIINDRIPT